MGFNDTATYVRADNANLIGKALAPLLERIGFVPTAEETMDESIAGYEAPHKLEHLAIWARRPILIGGASTAMRQDFLRGMTVIIPRFYSDSPNKRIPKLLKSA